MKERDGMEEKAENKVFLGVFTCIQNKEGLKELERAGGASSQPRTGVSSFDTSLCVVYIFHTLVHKP